MEWENQRRNFRKTDHGVYLENMRAGEGIYAKVMTDEQLETLRKQIAIYTSICERLAETHRTLSAQHDLAGGSLGVFFSDPLMKTTGRQRWTPTQVQLQILEQIFDQGNGTPSKQKIKDIASELSQHGQISEANVYNWFQNRRARSKRKQLAVSSNNNNGESEMETEIDASDQDETRLKNLTQSSETNTAPAISRAEDLCFQFQIPETSCNIDCFGILSNPRDDHIDGNVGLAESYNLYDHANDYDMRS